MGLDVYLYRIPDKQLYERVSELTDGDDLYDQADKIYPGDDDVAKKQRRDWIEAKRAAYAEETGHIQKHPEHDWWEATPDIKRGIEQPSATDPKHLLKLGYFRSSYNGAGLNSVLRDRDLPTLDDIFCPPSDEYYFRPNWEGCRSRAQEVLMNFQIHAAATGGRCAASYQPNAIGGVPPEAPKSIEDALRIYHEERRRSFDVSASVSRAREWVSRRAAADEISESEAAEHRAKIDAYEANALALFAAYDESLCRVRPFIFNPYSPAHLRYLQDNPVLEKVHAVQRYCDALEAGITADTPEGTDAARTDMQAVVEGTFTVRAIMPGGFARDGVEYIAYYVIIDENELPYDKDEVLGWDMSAYSNRLGNFDFGSGMATNALYFGVGTQLLSRKPEPTLYQVYEPQKDHPDDEPQKWYCDALRIVLETIDHVLAQPEHERDQYWLAWSG